MNMTIAVLMTMFLRFHIKLALGNKTTIENLEMKNKTYQSLYDIGPKRNWEQIFGINRLLWPFPVFCGSGKPLGDGIYWPTSRNDGKDPNSDTTNRNSAVQNARLNPTDSNKAVGLGQNRAAGFNPAQRQGQPNTSKLLDVSSLADLGGTMGNPNFNNQFQQRAHYGQQPVQYNPQQNQIFQ